MAVNSQAQSIKRDKSFPACGRLIVLQSLQGQDVNTILDQDQRFEGFTAINFPSMGDSIELVRRAEYMVSSPVGFPDGIHMYKGTAPLEIPISFKIHSFDDEYCPEGVKTLLKITGTMQALMLPFGPTGTFVTWNSDSERGTPTRTDNRSVQQNAQEPTNTYYTPPQNIYPPATCYLELILTERDNVGVACIGYVKDARCRLCGPFMKGPGISQNLPMIGEFEFTFVHHPGHGNNYTANANYTSPGEQQAYAQIVKDRLYNTVGLLTNPNNFVSFNNPTGK